MRQAADILASKAAMQIRYLEAMQQMAKSANSKVIFMPSASGLNTMTQKFGDDLNEGTEAGDSEFQQTMNASIVENI